MTTISVTCKKNSLGIEDFKLKFPQKHKLAHLSSPPPVQDAAGLDLQKTWCGILQLERGFVVI